MSSRMAATPGARRMVKPIRTTVSAPRARSRHGAGVPEVVAQRLLAEHVLTSSDEPFDDLTMQGVGYHHADDIDVWVLRNRLPRSVGALVSETLGGERAKLRTDVSDRDEPDARQYRHIERRRDSEGGSVRSACHARADHCDTNRHDHPLEAANGLC
jgi:hypothetical protein